jgi:RNA polymerase subunit RPABC4/transcription elongation factor Spt4
MNTTTEKSAQGTSTQPPGPGTGGISGALAILRPPAWYVASAVVVCFEVGMWGFAFQLDPEMRLWPLLGKFAFTLFIPAVLVTYVLLIGYVYSDSKRRGMRHVMWTLLAMFVPNALGIILYFLLRDPMPSPCPNCGFLAAGGFSYCPQCGSELLRVCRVCKKKIEPGWANCAYCGTPTGAQPNRAA